MNNPRRGRGRSGRRPNIPTRSQNFDSNGPEGRVRGNAQQVYEKYLALARDAQASGDRVLAEAFLQHAEHYYRVMNDSTDPDFRPREQQQQGQPGRGDGADEEPSGERGNQDRGFERRDDRYGERQQERRFDERRPDERRSDERRGEERRSEAAGPNGRAAGNGDLFQETEAHESERPEEGREGRLRERFNRRNGEGILTRRRGPEGEAERPNGGGDEEADAGLRKMLGDRPKPQANAEPAEVPAVGATAVEVPAAEAPAADESAEAAEQAPAKPRRRRRTRAETESKSSTEQTAE